MEGSCSYVFIEEHCSAPAEVWHVSFSPSGETLFLGPIPDQAALYGLLTRLRDLGVPLISVERREYVMNEQILVTDKERKCDMLTALGNTKLAELLLKVFASDSPLRRRLMDPAQILQGGQVRAGQTVLEVGCGRGFFSIPAAELVGQQGRLYALDVAGAAIEYVAHKAQVAGLANVTTIRADGAAAGLPAGEVDLVLLLGVIPAPTLPLRRLLPEMQRVLKPEALWPYGRPSPAGRPTRSPGAGYLLILGRRTGSIASKRQIVRRRQ